MSISNIFKEWLRLFSLLILYPNLLTTFINFAYGYLFLVVYINLFVSLFALFCIPADFIFVITAVRPYSRVIDKQKRPPIWEAFFYKV